MSRSSLSHGVIKSCCFAFSAALHQQSMKNTSPRIEIIVNQVLVLLQEFTMKIRQYFSSILRHNHVRLVITNRQLYMVVIYAAKNLILRNKQVIKIAFMKASKPPKLRPFSLVTQPNLSDSTLQY